MTQMSQSDKNILSSEVASKRMTCGAMERCGDWVRQHRNAVTSKQSKVADPQRIDHSAGKESDMSADDDYSESSEVSQSSNKHFYSSSHDPQGNQGINGGNSEKNFPTPRRKLKLSTMVLSLHCAWQDCKLNTTDVAFFISHVSSHIPTVSIKHSEESNEEVYVCLWDSCVFETPNGDEVTRHINFHSYHTKMKCVGAVVCSEFKLPDCNYGTGGVNLVPDLPHVLECGWEECTFTSNNPNTFYSHVHGHSLVWAPGVKHTSMSFKCWWRGCKAEVRTRVKLDEHLRTHSQERITACPTCGTLFSNRAKLMDHRRRQAPEECNTYQCSYCSKFYPSEKLLRSHMRLHVNTYKCKFCDMSCPSPYLLTMHIRNRHLDDKPFRCQYCEYSSKTHFNLKRHMTTHDESANFVCEEEECDFRSRTLFQLNWHYRKAHDSPYVYCCHMCDGRFSRGSILTRHLIGKHNFRWPSGHCRFRYKHHEDGLFRLQTVRYESLEVVEDINRGDGVENSFHKTDLKFNIQVKLATDNLAMANFVVMRDEDVDDPDDPDDPSELPDPLAYDEIKEETIKVKSSQSMPLLDMEDAAPNSKKVLICIDEVDSSGNVIHSQTLETDEVDVDQVENAHIVMDGDHLP